MLPPIRARVERRLVNTLSSEEVACLHSEVPIGPFKGVVRDLPMDIKPFGDLAAESSLRVLPIKWKYCVTLNIIYRKYSKEIYSKSPE